MKVPVSNCPACLSPNDRATSIKHGKNPCPGDFTVCLYCGQVMRFVEGLHTQGTTLDVARQELLPTDFRLLSRAVANILKGRPS